jgi:prepilin-type N-terminal cleavage/methylation domain-containing protein
VRTVTRQHGFSTLELLATLGIVGVVAAMAVPSTARTLADLRLSGDARGVHNAVALAKMRAAAHYTRERLYVDRTTNTYHLEFWDKTGGSGGTGDWTDEVDPSVSLQTGVNFGFGSIATAPPSTQSALAMSPPCQTRTGSDISNTSCIVFNSRGIPIDGAGNITGNSALYLTDGTSTYGVTLSATPLIRLWWSKAGAAGWVKR